MARAAQVMPTTLLLPMLMTWQTAQRVPNVQCQVLSVPGRSAWEGVPCLVLRLRGRQLVRRPLTLLWGLRWRLP